jgi:hypothetical protein
MTPDHIILQQSGHLRLDYKNKQHYTGCDATDALGFIVNRTSTTLIACPVIRKEVFIPKSKEK